MIFDKGFEIILLILTGFFVIFVKFLNDFTDFLKILSFL